MYRMSRLAKHQWLFYRFLCKLGPTKMVELRRAMHCGFHKDNLKRHEVSTSILPTHTLAFILPPLDQTLPDTQLWLNALKVSVFYFNAATPLVLKLWKQRMSTVESLGTSLDNTVKMKMLTKVQLLYQYIIAYLIIMIMLTRLLSAVSRRLPTTFT